MNKQPVLWLPFFVLAAISVSSLFIYYLRTPEKNAVIFIQVPLAVLSAAVFPIFSSFLKGKSFFLSSVILALFVFLSSILGSVFGFYHRFPLWDVLMHSLFGLVGSVVLWEVLSPSPILIILSVFGLSALWEVFEFSSDLILGGDAQRVKFSLQFGTNPISDTMTDIAVSGIGIALFFLLKILKKRKSS